MLTNLEKKLKFIEIVDEMKYIKRIIYLKDNFLENDAEHSYHLALMVMTFIDDFSELDYEKCLKLALIHDIVEIYAWDTAALDKQAEETKHQREKEAFEKLKTEFWEILPEIFSLLNDYENKLSRETKFVSSLDKIHPIMQSVMEWWKGFKEFKIDIEEIKQRQYSKIFPEFESLKQILEFISKKAFGKNLIYRK